MARRWVVSNGSNALEAHAARVAVGGIVKEITKACVAENGIVRQFYPPHAGTADSRINWNTDAITVSESVSDPLDAFAKIIFDRDLGTFTYDNFPNADVSGIYLNPAVTGANQYLIKVDQVSGTALTGTLATWIDLNSAATHQWSLDQTVVGTLAAVANISISQDDGGGSPVIGTTVVKAVTFNSEVTESNYIAWSPAQRDLVEIKEAVDADCTLTFNPAGWASGSADTSGAFTENWHSLSPAAPSPASFTVNATLVSGTAPTGSALGANLTLDLVREWTLLATTGENLSCELDVTVSDGITPITKRVTMNSQRTEAATSNVWVTTQWNLSDVTSVPDAGVTILVDVDGVVKVTQFNGPTTWSDDWHSEAPTPSDLANYEALMHVVTSGGCTITDPQDSWVNLAAGESWAVLVSSGEINIANIELSIRRIGDLAITRPIKVTLAVESP